MRKIYCLSLTVIFIVGLKLIFVENCYAKAHTTKNNLIEPQSPNILFILVDDLGWADFSKPLDTKFPDACCSFFETPNMNSLAEQEMIDDIKSKGAKVFYAHPYWIGHTFIEMTEVTGYLGTEVYNGAAKGTNSSFGHVHWGQMLNKNQFRY